MQKDDGIGFTSTIRKVNIILCMKYKRSNYRSFKMKINILFYLFALLILKFTFFSIDTIRLFDYISLASIFATFGSALLGTTIIFEQKSEQRVKENVGIFYLKILEQEEKWTRWAFLKRKKTKSLFDNMKNTFILENPEIPFDVGSHIIKVKLPTVAEDFFDLPVFNDFFKMVRFDKLFHTKANRGDLELDKTEFKDIGNYILSYQCIKDTLKQACIYRIASYFKHFSIGLIIFSILSILLHPIFK